jgi:hypothetical protein
MDEISHTNRIPEFDAMALLQARLASKGTGPQSTPSKGTIDPYQMMLGARLCIHAPVVHAVSKLKMLKDKLR